MVVRALPGRSEGREQTRRDPCGGPGGVPDRPPGQAWGGPGAGLGGGREQALGWFRESFRIDLGAGLGWVRGGVLEQAWGGFGKWAGEWAWAGPEAGGEGAGR